MICLLMIVQQTFSRKRWTNPDVGEADLTRRYCWTKTISRIGRFDLEICHVNSANQDAHLMPQANKLELQGGAAAKPEGEDGNDSGTKSQSCLGRYGSAAKISRLLGNSQFCASTSVRPTTWRPGAHCARLLAPHQLSRELALGPFGSCRFGAGNGRLSQLRVAEGSSLR